MSPLFGVCGGLVFCPSLSVQNIVIVTVCDSIVLNVRLNATNTQPQVTVIT